jgi:hypothetical protein
MSDETYYTILSVKDTASPAEIKTAYRELIKQVHPDTVTNLAPYLRRIAEEKAKEITEAYTVLSNSVKRREYDKQLAEYWRQTTPQTPPPTTPPPARQSAYQTSSGPYCNACGTSLHVSGFCPKCNKFKAPTWTPQQRRVVRWLGYDWSPLMRWVREHPMIAISIPIVLVWVVAALSSNDASSQPDASCPATQRVEINGKFVCQPPVQVASTSKSVALASAAYTVVGEEDAPSKPIVLVSGTYLGTVHNQTANLSSSFAAVLHQTKAGMLGGCVEIKPPLYGSGALHGSIRGSHLDFIVADITFRGDTSKSEIAGSYVVSRQDGQQLGDFRLTKQPRGGASYGCAGGKLAVEEAVAPVAQPYGHLTPGYMVFPAAPKSNPPLYATVNGNSDSALYKRCAFLPLENYGRCNWGPEEIAELKQGDRVRILSPLTRAQSGDDIYKVRTQQGWEGWIKAESVTREPQ